MSESRWWRGLPLTAVLLLAALAGLPGCAPSLHALGPVRPPPLAPDEGLLIVHVDSSVPLHEVLLDEGAVAEGIGTGRHVWMMRAAAGRYCWEGVRATGRNAVQSVTQEERCFEIAPGAICYGGALIVRDPWRLLGGDRPLSLRVTNRAATAIRALRDREAATLAAYPIRYTGPGNDSFLAYYEGVRRGAMEPAARSADAPDSKP